MIIKSAYQFDDSLLKEHLNPSTWVDHSVESGVVNKSELGRIHFWSVLTS
jgi:hypothetical protein